MTVSNQSKSALCGHGTAGIECAASQQGARRASCVERSAAFVPRSNAAGRDMSFRNNSKNISFMGTYRLREKESQKKHLGTKHSGTLRHSISFITGKCAKKTKRALCKSKNSYFANVYHFPFDYSLPENSKSIKI
jgi:hypothetical protein